MTRQIPPPPLPEAHQFDSLYLDSNSHSNQFITGKKKWIHHATENKQHDHHLGPQ